MKSLAPLARKYGFDVVIVLAALAGAIEVLLAQDAPDGPESPAWFAALATAFLILILLGRRRWPFAAPAFLWVAAAALSFIDGRLVVYAITAQLAGIAAAVLLGLVPDAFQSRVGLAVVLGCAVILLYNNPLHTVSSLLFLPLLFALAWLGGYALRERGARAEAAEERATEAERERETAARVAVAEERARIARELHDVVAHSVSVMVLQVGAVRHRLPTGHEEDKAALQSVEETGRTALTEMRRLLGAMRSADDAAELGPQPGLDNLDALAERVGRAGLPVRLQVEGERLPLPRGIDLSAYRIVQEGLTNALKHSGASQADVTIRYRPDQLQIEVRDNGRGASTSDGLGHGLFGIRERVKLYGGEMSAGSASTGGFVLETRLPLREDR
jgi:signal transduction histidine kinase